MIKLAIFTALVLSGCSNFTLNGVMCDEIAREPGMTLPDECRVYDEKAADKAFHKIHNEKKSSDKDIQFDIKEK